MVGVNPAKVSGALFPRGRSQSRTAANCVAAKHDVLRFEIAVGDAVRMQVIERLAYRLA